jgi:hypothetical protein
VFSPLTIFLAVLCVLVSERDALRTWFFKINARVQAHIALVSNCEAPPVCAVIVRSACDVCTNCPQAPQVLVPVDGAEHESQLLVPVPLAVPLQLETVPEHACPGRLKWDWRSLQTICSRHSTSRSRSHSQGLCSRASFLTQILTILTCLHFLFLFSRLQCFGHATRGHEHH